MQGGKGASLLRLTEEEPLLLAEFVTEEALAMEVPTILPLEVEGTILV